MSFEETSYSVMEGSNLSMPILLRHSNNQSPFNLSIRAVTIDSIVDQGLGAFINAGAINKDSRATAGLPDSQHIMVT